jgi:hypothetical protein
VKLIVWDGTGLCLFAKRLEQGSFRWPKIENQEGGSVAAPGHAEDGHGGLLPVMAVRKTRP